MTCQRQGQNCELWEVQAILIVIRHLEKVGLFHFRIISSSRLWPHAQESKIPGFRGSIMPTFNKASFFDNRYSATMQASIQRKSKKHVFPIVWIFAQKGTVSIFFRVQDKIYLELFWRFNVIIIVCHPCHRWRIIIRQCMLRSDGRMLGNDEAKT